jgi:hypothetical protein
MIIKAYNPRGVPVSFTEAGLSSGQLIPMGDATFRDWNGYINSIELDDGNEGTIIFIPNVSPDKIL